jgi:flagellar biosynthesis protein FlhB
MSTKKIEPRDDVDRAEGERKYGDVKFADETNNKYPIDTPEHVRAAWNYINHKDNAAKYEAGEVETIKSRIRRAAKEHGVEIGED